MPQPHDWPANAHMTGYWFLDPDPAWSEPPELSRFLADGPPPVCVSFGNLDFPVFRRAAIAAIRQAGSRALIVGRPNEADDDAAADVLRIDPLPFLVLLPRVKALVHHGGAGTTAAALASGIPNVVVSFFADQHFWGDRVARLGVGPPPIHFSQLTEHGLAEAVRKSAALAERASALGERIRREDGVARAVELITQYLNAKS